jgi:hypothetical protein
MPRTEARQKLTPEARAGKQWPVIEVDNLDFSAILKALEAVLSAVRKLDMVRAHGETWRVLTSVLRQKIEALRTVMLKAGLEGLFWRHRYQIRLLGQDEFNSASIATYALAEVADCWTFKSSAEKIEQALQAAVELVRDALLSRDRGRGRPTKYPGAMNYALRLLEEKPKPKDRAIHRLCKESFPEEQLPADPDTFMRRVREHRHQRGRN